jgi:hypothetical protein
MDELQKLYDVLVREGKYTKSFEEFQTKWSQDQAYKDKVYDVVSRDGLYTKDKNSFLQKYSSSQPALATAVQPADSKKKVQTGTVSSLADGSSVYQAPKEITEEEDYFTGSFGNVLRGFDKVVPIGLGDFIDDMARSVASGYRQGSVAEEADRLLLQGTKPTEEQIQKFIAANKNAQRLGPSAEMKNYDKIYQEEGKGFWGVVKGLANNPSIIPEVITSSLTAMATNTDALTAGGAAIGTGAGIGAAAGAPVGGVGAIPGAIAGATTAIPYAFGLASSVVEMGSTFGELLTDELGGKEMTKENVKSILENPEKLNSIRNKAIARGIVIGTVDAMTGKLASGVGAKVLSKSAAKSATGAATKGAVIKATAAGSGVESLGGAAGEAAARGAIGQEMDVSEIALEGFGELPGGIRSTIQARLAKPIYKVNGEKVSAEQVDELIETMSPADLAKTKIEIKNDYAGREFKMQDKIVTDAIKQQVRQANPELNEPSLNAITELEKELSKLEGNKTQTGKDKAAAIRTQIKGIQENQLQEEAVAETIADESPDVSKKRTDRIAEIENTLSINERNLGVEGGLTLPDELKAKLQTELETLKSEQDAIQKQTTGEGVLRTEQSEMGLQQVGEGNLQPQGLTEGTQETITPEGTQEVVSSKTRVNIAPFFNTRVETVEQANQLREDEGYKQYKEQLLNLAKQLGLSGVMVDNVIGGFKNEAGEDFIEISNQITFENATLDQAEEFAAVAATIAPEVQEATIAAKYVNEGDETHNANEYSFKVDNIDSAMKALKEAGISNFSINEADGVVTFTDVFDFADEQLQQKMGRFAELLDENNISYEQQQYKPTESRYVDKGKRKEIIRRIKSEGSGPQQRGEGFSETIEQSIQRDAEFQGTTPEEYSGVQPSGPIAGNRLFNKPLKAVSQIADRYYQRVFGTQRPKFYGSRGLDEVKAKKISDAFIAMKHDPNNPEVKAAYNAMAKETLAQYKEFLDAGFTVEINNEEPYANSQEMIDDLRNNKRIKIFSTESGFGDTPITAKQRKENPLLAKTKFKDKNGQPMLVNDLFRAVHDFFGHAELGNSFGPKGEENAWNVHARMFSPLARRAMTTETRGQNSFVNFSGVNEDVDAIREQARKLREEGKFDEAKALVDKIYEEGSFAEQKVGLLPEEFSQFDEQDMGDVSMRPEGLQERDNVEDLLTLDTSDATNLQKVAAFLDKIDNALSKELKPNQLNDVTRVLPLGVAKVIVKALKVLVNTGITLQEAIRRVSADNNVSEQDVLTALDIVSKATQNVSEGVSEFELAGYNALSDKVDAMIATQTKKKVDPAKIEKNVIALVKKSDAYKNATDVQKEKLIREARAKLGLKEKSAPSVARLRTEPAETKKGESFFDKFFGAVKKDTKVTMTEKALLKKQIRDLGRGAKTAKMAWMAVSSELSKGIKALTSRGTITDSQAKNVLRKFSKVNMFSQKSIDSFIDYMTNVFANAEYASKLSQATGLKKDISKLAKNKDKNANLRDLAQQFIKIEPSMVEDIDAYNDMASKIKEAIKGSTIRGEKVKFASTVNIENASEYINETIKAQDETMRQQKIDEIQELMGVDASELSYDDMMQLLDSKEPITKYNEGIIRSTIQKMFDLYSTLIQSTLETGKDPFTDADVEITKNQKNLIRRFMDMDLTVLKPKQALQAVDALANFFENRSTAKMEAVLAEYTGNANAKQLVKDGIVAQPLKKYWSEKIGRFLGEQTTNLNILFERMFKGFNRGGKVEDASGVTMLKNNKSMAERQANNIVEKYIAEFYKRKANNEAFNSEYNSTERGLAAFMMRNIIGTEKEMKTEFERRKGLIEQSIEVLSQGNEKEKAKSELYQKVYDKILKDSKSIQDVKDNTDATNLEGIDFWNKEWADKYEQLSDVSLNIYNKVLDKDLNYTPDKFVKLSTETGTVELSNDESAFHNNNGTIYKKETGVLMTAVKPDDLPTNPKNGETSMYIDLSFDKNNSNSMYDALVDIGTAGPIRQIEAFLNSPDFKKIVPKAEDAKILKERIQLYVGNIRNKNPYSNDELSNIVRGLNRIASIGVGQALGGVLQPVKQMIPVAMNTLINAGNLDMGAIFDASKNAFINRSGFAISNRGIESQAQIESLNKLIDEASKTKGQELVKKIENLNKWWLETFLVKPDVFIARASWMTYYEQSLKKQGIDTKGIDYDTHEVNQEAAEYAQRMVDRQQNVSDADLAGKMFSNKEATNQLFVKMLMPFASFRMNQSARLGSDLAVLTDKTATAEDKKIAIRSLSGFAVEMATFKMVAAGSGILLGSLTRLITGDDEEEEEYKKRVNNIIKGQVTSSFTDVVSPLPILDKAFQEGGNFLTETMLGIPKESVFSIYNVPKQEYVQSLGLFGIAADRAGQLYEIGKLSTTGKYVDDFGKEKEISDDNKNALRLLIGPAILSNVGLAPVEVNSIVRNAIKNAKKGTAKSAEDVEAKAERDEARQESLSQKIEALNTLRDKAVSDDEVNAIDEKIAELEATPEEKKELEAENKEEKELKRELLTDPETGEEYDNETELKRYNPRLYNQNFGPQSDWYKDHKDEKKIQKKMNQEIRKIEDAEKNYVAPPKKKGSSKRNSDGSIKSSSRKYTRRDANGNVISSYSRTTN